MRANIKVDSGRSSNGKTADSGSAYRGSSPCLPATLTRFLHRSGLLDECPFPTLADAYEISTRLYAVTLRYAVVRNTGHTLYGSESNRFMLPSHYRAAFPRRRVVLTSRIRRLPARPSPIMLSTNPLPVCVCPAPDTPSQDHRPCAVLRRRLPY